MASDTAGLPVYTQQDVLLAAMHASRITIARPEPPQPKAGQQVGVIGPEGMHKGTVYTYSSFFPSLLLSPTSLH